MKVFLSHHSAQKPLVRQLRDHFPEHVKTWLDEDKLLIGDEIEQTLETAIAADTDFLLLFVDGPAVASGWIAKEIKWVLAQEEARGRTILLPVLIDKEAWSRLEPEELRKRKYQELHSFSADSVRNLAERIVADLFALVSRDLVVLRGNAASENRVDVHTSALLLAGFMKKMDNIWEAHFDAAGKVVNSIGSDDGLARFYDHLDDFFVSYWKVFDAYVNRKVDTAGLELEINTQWSQAFGHAEQTWRDTTRILRNSAAKLVRQRPKKIVARHLDIQSKAEEILQDVRASRMAPPEDRLKRYKEGAILLHEFIKKVAKG